MLDDQKPPQYMTSQELEEAIRKHRAYAKRLLVEAKLRRSQAGLTVDNIDGNLQKEENPNF